MSWGNAEGNADVDEVQLAQSLRHFDPEVASSHASTSGASADSLTLALAPAYDRLRQDPWELAHEAMLEEESEQGDDESCYQPSEPAQPLAPR